MTIRAALKRCRADQSGATAIEYGLIAAMIAVVVVAIAGTGGVTEALYDMLGRATEAMADANSR